jgi:hypothetical protein
MTRSNGERSSLAKVRNFSFRSIQEFRIQHSTRVFITYRQYMYEDSRLENDGEHQASSSSRQHTASDQLVFGLVDFRSLHSLVFVRLLSW